MVDLVAGQLVSKVDDGVGEIMLEMNGKDGLMDV